LAEEDGVQGKKRKKTLHHPAPHIVGDLNLIAIASAAGFFFGLFN